MRSFWKAITVGSFGSKYPPICSLADRLGLVAAAGLSGGTGVAAGSGPAGRSSSAGVSIDRLAIGDRLSLLRTFRFAHLHLCKNPILQF
jgi:hypothetical protein